MGIRPPFRIWTLASITSSITALAVLLCGWLNMVHESQIEQQRLLLYWSSYAAQYAQSHSGLKGIDKQLTADGPYYPETKRFEITILNTEGQQIASYGSIQLHQTKVIEKSKVIFVDGLLTGKLVIYLQPKNWPTAMLWVQALITGIVVFGIALIWMYFMVGQLNRTLIRIKTQAQGLLTREQAAKVDVLIKDKSSTQFEDLLDAVSHALAAAQAHIDKLETVRRTMVADVAHELRTPIAILRTTLDNALFASAPLSLEKLSFLHAETMRVSKLVFDLQELALAESGHLRLEKRWFSLSELVSSTVETLGVDADEKGLNVQFHTEKDVQIYADENRIRQLIVNLLGNALRHAAKDVTVSVGLSSEGVFLSISDDGNGIEQEDLPHLFERFFRSQSGVPANKTLNGTGLGLGLAIVKQYAEAHRGRIAVDSTWGEGAIFTIILPVMSDEQSA